MSDIPTVPISAKSYDEALAFCNARLAEDDKPLIGSLPAGVPGDPNSCPCSNACGVYVEARWWGRGFGPARYDGPVNFVKEFDEKCGIVHGALCNPRPGAYLPVRMES